MSNGAPPDFGFHLSFLGGGEANDPLTGEGAEVRVGDVGWFEFWPQRAGGAGAPTVGRRVGGLFPITDTGDEFRLRAVEWRAAPFAPVLGSGKWPRLPVDPEVVQARRIALWGAVGNRESGLVLPDRLYALRAHHEDARAGILDALERLVQARRAQRAVVYAVGRMVQDSRPDASVMIRTTHDLQQWWVRLTGTTPTYGPAAGRSTGGPMLVTAEEVRDSFEAVLAGWPDLRIHSDRLPGGPPAGLAHYQAEWHRQMAAGRAFEDQLLDTEALLAAHRDGERAPAGFLLDARARPSTREPSELARELVEMATRLMIRNAAREGPGPGVVFKVHPGRTSGPKDRYVEFRRWKSTAQILQRVDHLRGRAKDTTYRYLKALADSKSGLPQWMEMAEWTTELDVWYALAARTADAMVKGGRAGTAE